MHKSESLKLFGRWRLTARNIHTGEVIVHEGPNLIVTIGPELVGDMLMDRDGYDTGLTYQAIGTGVTAPAVADTILTTEVARKAITYKTRTNNVVTYSTFFTATESTFDLKEAGIFGHSTASTTPNSGVFFSHWLEAFDNSAGTYDLTYDYILTVGG